MLIRALEPLEGVDLMRARRGLERREDLCSGPGKLTQALGIELELNGSDLVRGPITIEPPPADWPPIELIAGPRIGITKAAELPWRFCAAGFRVGVEARGRPGCATPWRRGRWARARRARRGRAGRCRPDGAVSPFSGAVGRCAGACSAGGMSAGSSGSGAGFGGSGSGSAVAAAAVAVGLGRGLARRGRRRRGRGGGGARDRRDALDGVRRPCSLSSAGGSILITDSMNVFQMPAGKVPPATGSPLNSVSIGISLLG